MKRTKKDIIKHMLAEELHKDERFAQLSPQAAIAAIEIDKPWLSGKAYLLYRAFKGGLSELKKKERHFDDEACMLNRKLEWRKKLISWSRDIRDSVEKELKDPFEALPF